ncbi:hypothetical protein MINT15_35830 [Saccharomonospora viridis]|uniref:Uncharacterized protein n=1 Tax=Saccharomonospora viridis TaxID=1852 RepID=A0A837D9V7_9PSEU|nr:hypothetical protein MINT15_35830 [Saccharomonospora viridis]
MGGIEARSCAAAVSLLCRSMVWRGGVVRLRTDMSGTPE